MELPQELITDRLILRPHKSDDFDGFFAAITNEKATRFLRFSPEERTPEGTRSFYDEILALQETDNPIFGLAVLEKGSRNYVGLMGLTPLADNSETEAFYIFLPDFWKHGYATEAVKKLMEYAFSILNLSKIVTFVPPDSPASIRVAEKLGMKLEGKQDHNDFLTAVRKYAMKKEDFFFIKP